MQRRLKSLFRRAVATSRGWFTYSGNSKVFFPSNSYCADCVLRSGGYEQEIEELLRTAAIDGTTVFDVGANIGLSAIPLLDKFNKLRVVSFEASPAVLPFLLKTHGVSPFKERWELVPKAVTAQSDSVASFAVHQGGNDVFDGLRHTRRANGVNIVSVPTTTVDEEWWQRGSPAVSLLKIDVEGGELDVIRGSLECIAKSRPTILTEWSPKNFQAYNVPASSMLELASTINYEVLIVPTLIPAGSPEVFAYQIALNENLMLLPRERINNR